MDIFLEGVIDRASPPFYNEARRHDRRHAGPPGSFSGGFFCADAPHLTLQ